MQAITKVFSDIVKPYIDTADENLQNQSIINGAVNMLPNTGTTQVINGVTFTVNADGTITINGTASARTSFDIYHEHAEKWLKKNIEYKATVDNSVFGGLSTQDCFVQLFREGSPYPRIATFDGSVFTVPDSYFNISQNLSVQIVINNGVTLTNQTIKPMISVASYNGDYAPYAKSNKELTDIVTNQLGDATLAGTYLSDCNNVASSGTLNIYGATSSTANSPYTTGVETGANSFVILSRVDTNTNWGMQLAIPVTSTKGIYMRFKASGTWGTWSKITP